MSLLPNAKFIEVGNEVWLKDAMPQRKFKVIGVVYAHDFPFKDMIWIEDPQSNEKFCVLTEWVSEGDPTERWRKEKSEPEESEYRAIKNLDTKKELELKDKSVLSAEVHEDGKLPQEILASKLTLLDFSKEEELRYTIASQITQDTDVDDITINGFVDNANFGKSVDGTYWAYWKTRKVAIRLDKHGEVKKATYYVKGTQTRPQDFFRIEKASGIKIEALADQEYLLHLGDDKYILGSDDFELFCQDWNLNKQQINTSLGRNGVWTFD